MCQDHSTKICNTCNAEKSITEFDLYKNGRLYRLFCKDCRRVKDRITAEKIRRKKGVVKTKNVQSNCVDCGIFYVKNVAHQIRCFNCQEKAKIKINKEYKFQKSRSLGFRALGSEETCAHCQKTFLLTAAKQKYCPDCRSLQKKNALPDMKKHAKKYYKQYIKNPEKRRKTLDTANIYRNNKRKTDVIFSLITRIRSRLLYAFRAKGYKKQTKTHETLGCTWAELKLHIERQFLPGMTWENRAKWHIDHIIPLATAKTEEDVVKLNHHTNLRPMWAQDNLRKSAKLESLL